MIERWWWVKALQGLRSSSWAAGGLTVQRQVPRVRRPYETTPAYCHPNTCVPHLGMLVGLRQVEASLFVCCFFRGLSTKKNQKQKQIRKVTLLRTMLSGAVRVLFAPMLASDFTRNDGLVLTGDVSAPTGVYCALFSPVSPCFSWPSLARRRVITTRGLILTAGNFHIHRKDVRWGLCAGTFYSLMACFCRIWIQY